MDQANTKWKKIKDQTRDRYYYYDTTTGKTTWQQPADYNEESSSSKASSSSKWIKFRNTGPKLEQDWDEIFDTKKGCYIFINRKSGTVTLTRPVDYIPIQDQEYYYYNTKTGASVWKKPADFDGDDDSFGFAQVSKSGEWKSIGTKTTPDDYIDKGLNWKLNTNTQRWESSQGGALNGLKVGRSLRNRGRRCTPTHRRTSIIKEDPPSRRLTPYRLVDFLGLRPRAIERFFIRCRDKRVATGLLVPNRRYGRVIRRTDVTLRYGVSTM